MSYRRSVLWALLFVALLSMAISSASGAIVTEALSTGTFANPGLSTGQAHTTGTPITWNYTGNFSDPRYRAYVTNQSTMSNFHSTNMLGGDTYSNTAYGPDVPAGTPAYIGVEFYYIAFTLPAQATAVSLSFSRIAADDRLQLQLNNGVIGYWGGSGGTGRMDGLGSQATVTGVSFNANYANPPTLSAPSLFNIGGQNVLRFWVNNTGSSYVNANITSRSSGNPSVLDVRATLAYELNSSSASVPEPASLLVFGGLSALGLPAIFRIRRRQENRG